MSNRSRFLGALACALACLASYGAMADDVRPQLPTAIVEVEESLSERGLDRVRVKSWDAAADSLALCGVVASRDQLDEVRQIGADAANVEEVDVSGVIVAGESTLPAMIAFRDVLGHLQDGKRFEQVAAASRALIGSEEPQLQNAGIVLMALSELHTGNPQSCAAWLRVAREIEPGLATPEGLRLYFSAENFREFTQMSPETWNSDIVNPYFVASRPLPSLIHSVAHEDDRDGLAVVAFRPSRGELSYVAFDDSAAAEDLPPADLPPEAAAEADEHHHHHHPHHAHHHHWPAGVDYGYGRACAYPYGWCPAYSNSYAPGYYYWHHRPTYVWTPYYFPGYVPTYTTWWPYYATAYSYPYPYAAGYPYWYGYAAPYPYAYYPYAYGVTFPYAYSYPYAPGYGYAGYPSYYWSAWSWPTYDGWYSYRHGYSTLGWAGWYPGRNLLAWHHRHW